jgi:hypothetical protein
MCVELTVSLLFAFKLKQSKRGSFGGEKTYKSVMSPSKEISFEEKVRIQHLFRLGIAAKDIAKKLGRHPASIQKHIAVFKSRPPDELPPPPIKRSGGKRLSNGRLDNRLRHYVQQFPFKTSKELKNEVPCWEKG